MGTMINHGKELIRICPSDPRRLEVSYNGGYGWALRYMPNPNTGAFLDLLESGKEIIATTDRGLFASLNDGNGFVRRN